jgi:ubiquinone/menaquinone biosynthesis C-methylase UbiE
MERAGAGEHRQRLLAGLSGTVIEVGAGNGANFAHYPREVIEVVAVEPEPHLRRRAERAAEEAPVKISVVDGMAERLPVEDAAFDAAVASLVLCSVADQAMALRELYRAVRPGGELRFFEHVGADTPGLRRVQRALDATIWPHLFGGCHAGRDTAGAIGAAGFAIEHSEKFHLPHGPTSPHILGMAFRPSPSVGTSR